VTLQTRSDDLKDKARVIQHMDRPSCNPFDTHIETHRLWEYIRDLLPEKPGYHLRGIEKGILGEPSKIREEAEELIDAYEQDSRVMELVELSDLMGAVEAFLAKRHPGYTLDDLKTFSAITQRAFVNGRRS
jgi:phosphoribosyl-ATP pyrophosphohydrolase